MLSVGRLGVRWEHDPDFVIDRPGTGDYLLVHFTRPALVRAGEQLVKCPPHTCILYAPDQPQCYRGDGCGLSNDWVHFLGPGAHTLVKEYGIPLAEPLRLAQTGFIPLLINDIRAEIYRREPHYEEVVDLLLRQLLVMLRRNLDIRERRGFSGRKAELADSLTQLRDRVVAQLDRPWRVADLAREVHLSRSRFVSVFREFFGCSPIEMLIDARVRHAQWMLGATTLSVRQVGVQCGFGSLAYFSRVFKKRVGCPPSEFATKFERFRSLTSDANETIADKGVNFPFVVPPHAAVR